MHETISDIGSEKNAAEAPNRSGRRREEKKNTSFLVSDSGRDMCICPSAVIISTLTYWNDRGMIMHSNMNIYLGANDRIWTSFVKSDAKSLDPNRVNPNITTV